MVNIYENYKKKFMNMRSVKVIMHKAIEKLLAVFGNIWHHSR